MDAKELLIFAEQFFGGSIELMKKKNHDYTGGSEDPFANFTVVEKLHITAEQGFITRMSDKLMRISTFVHKGTLQVSDESIKDTLRDLANYSMLLAAYIESKKLKAKSETNDICENHSGKSVQLIQG